jgi:putative YjhG/YagF family dehydratase
MPDLQKPSLDQVLGRPDFLNSTRIIGDGPQGRLPLTREMLLDEPSGNIFALSQAAGMGWDPQEVLRPNFLILSTSGGIRSESGEPIALGLHTGHWELELLVKEAANTLREQGGMPFAVACSDPCDGRTQGTTGMMDSLAYRNDAATVFRRLIRSLPTCQGVIGVASCDKGLPAMMMALAGSKSLPGAIIPGGVTLPARDGEDAGKIQSIGARYAHDLVSLEYAAEMSCRVCGSSGGGCQFLGTAATSQVVCEALGLALPHTALMPSGEPVWIEAAQRTALSLLRLFTSNITLADILTPSAIENAMLLHAAFGGSTNLLMHLPAIAHAAGLQRSSVDDWIRVNRATPRLVDVLPNGPRGHPTVQVFMAGGVPEVMLHLRDLGLLNLDVLTVSGEKLAVVLDWWKDSERRYTARQHLRDAGIEPDEVIFSPASAKQAGLTSTLVFPTGNLAPHGSVVKATAIDPSVVGDDGVYHLIGKARVFTSEHAAIQAIKGREEETIGPGEVLVYIGGGPMGTGMEEIYEVTAALKHLPWGKHIPLLTDARFSGVSTGACIGHIAPEALAGGPIGRLRDHDLLEITIDRINLSGRIDLVGVNGEKVSPETALAILESRAPHPDLTPHPSLPDDTRIWAALQEVCGGIWAGAVFDADRILEVLQAGVAALNK